MWRITDFPRISNSPHTGVPPGTCEVQVTFKPTAAMKYTGTMKIIDNLEPSFEQSVTLKGAGKTAK